MLCAVLRYHTKVYWFLLFPLFDDVLPFDIMPDSKQGRKLWFLRRKQEPKMFEADDIPWLGIHSPCKLRSTCPSNESDAIGPSIVMEERLEMHLQRHSNCCNLQFTLPSMHTSIAHDFGFGVSEFLIIAFVDQTIKVV